MSYKFNLDHTLAIADIHDMITIDIKPETRCSVTGGDVEIHGYLTFRGSYLTPDLGEAPFEGSVPLDITLPYLGGAPDIRPEVVSFDYRVENKKSLTLNLEIALKGYVENDNRDAVLDAWIEPIEDEPVYEEAIIEPFEFDTPPEAIVPEEAQFYHEEVPSQAETSVAEEQVARLDVPEEVMEAPAMLVEEEVFEEIPYSPLVDLEERTVEVEAVQFDSYQMPEVEVIQESVVEAPFVEEAEEREAPPMSESAMALMDELFALKRGAAFKEKTAVREEVLAATALEREEVSKEASTDSVDSVGTSVSTVARQFADGETTIKMVYVEEETETLGGVLERFEASLDDVWNLSELADGVSVGDCVMLRYEKTL